MSLKLFFNPPILAQQITSMKPTHIFLVFGKEIKKDFSNVKSIDTKVIPNIGEEIVLKDGVYKVHRKLINYVNIQDYDLKEEGRGGEMIYIFV